MPHTLPDGPVDAPALTDALSVARGLVSAMLDAAVLLDRNLSIVHFNGPYATLTGLRRRTLERELAQGASPFQLLGLGGAEDLRHAEACMGNGQVIRLAETSVKNHAGEAFTVLLSFVPVVDSQGQAVGLIQTFRDVSDEARVQARYKELLALERARAEQLERQVEQRTRELVAALEEVTRLSATDPLTGLLNRRAFAQHADQALKLADRYKRNLGLLLCDLDYFKKFNDTYGHQAGDVLLQAAAKALQGAVRTTDKVARFGGEEFIILLVETDPEQVNVVGQRCLEAIRTLPIGELVPGVRNPQTVSVGVAVYPDCGDTLDQLIGNADLALYQAKRRGRDRMIMFTPDLAEAAAEAGPAEPVTTSALSESRPRVLVVDSDNERLNAINGLLGGCNVLHAQGATAALALCRRETLDVIVVDEESLEPPHGDGGVELLRISLRYRPDTLRILILSKEDDYVRIRATNLARVDCFLLRNDVSANLRSAIDDGLVQREINRQKLLSGAMEVPPSYAQHVEELEDLLAQKAIRFAYQPIVCVDGRKTCAYEALLRVAHPVFRDPVALLDAAVQSGNIWRLGRMVREIAAAPLGALPPDTLLFINLHPAEIDDPHLADLGTITPDMARRIVFEITERAAIPDYHRFRETLAAMRSHGFRFAVDDLGAGYASLNSVAQLAPDFIKIDMGLVRDIHTSLRRVRLISRIIDYANDEGIRVVAEGIEQEAEADTLAGLGCHLLQGYHFGRPAPLKLDEPAAAPATDPAPAPVTPSALPADEP